MGGHEREPNRISLRYDRTTSVVARDLEKGKVLLGGLGGLGVGQMWVDEEPEHKEYPGYDESEMAES